MTGGSGEVLSPVATPNGIRRRKTKEFQTKRIIVTISAMPVSYEINGCRP